MTDTQFARLEALLQQAAAASLAGGMIAATRRPHSPNEARLLWESMLAIVERGPAAEDMQRWLIGDGPDQRHVGPAPADGADHGGPVIAPPAPGLVEYLSRKTDHT